MRTITTYRESGRLFILREMEILQHLPRSICARYRDLHPTTGCEAVNAHAQDNSYGN